MERKLLREVVQERIGRRWAAWAQDHPHLAEVVDRTRLVEMAVERLSEDDQLRTAMCEARLDAEQLTAAARLLERAQAVVERVLPI